MQKKIATILLFTVLFSGFPSPTSAVFNKNDILSDEELRRSHSMSAVDIALFLTKRGNLQQTFDVDTGDGLLKSAAEIIDSAAKRYTINPKAILALIQKESSVVESSALTPKQLEWAAGYALCDGCYKSAPLAQKYRGFAKQVDAAAAWFDWYLRDPSGTGLKLARQTYTISGVPVTPANNATAALYNYTPHLHGNRLFFTVWNRYFGDGATSVTFPDGTLLRNAKTGAVAVVQGKNIRPILNESVLHTRFQAVAMIDLADTEFNTLMKSAVRPVQFPDFSLLRTEDGSVYLLVGNAKRRIESESVFAALGFNPEEIEDVKKEDLSDYTDGVPITLLDAKNSPLGVLMQDSATGGVYYVESGIKNPITDKTILLAKFRGQRITPVSSKALAAYATGATVQFTDGTLIKSHNDPAVYFISNGKRLPIPSEYDFISFGFQWSQIISVPESVVKLHPIGNNLTVDNEVQM